MLLGLILNKGLGKWNNTIETEFSDNYHFDEHIKLLDNLIEISTKSVSETKVEEEYLNFLYQREAAANSKNQRSVNDVDL